MDDGPPGALGAADGLCGHVGRSGAAEALNPTVCTEQMAAASELSDGFRWRGGGRR